MVPSPRTASKRNIVKRIPVVTNVERIPVVTKVIVQRVAEGEGIPSRARRDKACGPRGQGEYGDARENPREITEGIKSETLNSIENIIVTIAQIPKITAAEATSAVNTSASYPNTIQGMHSVIVPKGSLLRELKEYIRG